MKFIWILLTAFLTINPHWAGAYELATHGSITYQAYLKSNLNSNTLLQNLGIDVLLTSSGTSENPFGDTYYDVQGGTISARSKNVFENGIIGGLGVSSLTLPGWLMRGAIREDDLGAVLGINVGDDPHDDPYGNIFRVRNHFYDPPNNRPLTIFGSARGETAPNWALGTTAAFASPVVENTTRRNHFTIYDAREAMYRALTGKTKSGSDAGPNATPATASIRKTWWATTIRALGDVLHLNQDMAQPQHTRNDPHAGAAYDGNSELLGHKSFYENYIEARATGGKFDLLNGTKVDSKPLTYGDYPIPAFAKYSDYWSTAPGTTTGNGLADYSNRGFFICFFG